MQVLKVIKKKRTLKNPKTMRVYRKPSALSPWPKKLASVKARPVTTNWLAVVTSMFSWVLVTLAAAVSVTVSDCVPAVQYVALNQWYP